MLPVILMLIVAPVTVVPQALFVHLATAQLSTWVRRWSRAAAYLLFAAGQTYLYGFLKMSTFWGNSPRDKCLSYYRSWDSRYGHGRYWPLERRCSEFVDMVPGFVNPLIVIALVAAFTCALAAVASLVRRHRPRR
ncbi:hypothetical protein ACH495_04785 [Micromonospora sp. NPDC018662]|uniref:hypothetical protein n=1 Tax=Micromonospora sp. NPDC018662 TaxID=3364238 RepID=UPI00378F4E32